MLDLRRFKVPYSTTETKDSIGTLLTTPTSSGQAPGKKKQRKRLGPRGLCQTGGTSCVSFFLGRGGGHTGLLFMSRRDICIH